MTRRTAYFTVYGVERGWVSLSLRTGRGHYRRAAATQGRWSESHETGHAMWIVELVKENTA